LVCHSGSKPDHTNKGEKGNKQIDKIGDKVKVVFGKNIA
jgi:hypothetical protein